MYESDAGLLAPGGKLPAEATTGDSAFLQAMLDAEAALTRAQSACGLAPAEAGRAVTETADAYRFDVRDLALRARSGGNPVIPLVVDLMAAVPEDARAYVHRGATSQDILDTAAMLVASRMLATVLDDLERAAGEVARHATTHRDTQMAGRTLTQHAVPTTFGLKAAGWRALILDARDRLTAVRASLPAQLGGAAGTLAAFSAFSAPAASATAQEDEEQEETGGHEEVDLLALVAAYARELGLAEPVLPWHTLRTPIADLAGALAFTAGALGKMAADVLTLSRTEIGEVEEEEGGDSSALPHKANPVHATLIAAAARRAQPGGHPVRLAGRRGRAARRGVARRVGAAARSAAARRRRGARRRRARGRTAGRPVRHAGEPPAHRRSDRLGATGCRVRRPDRAGAGRGCARSRGGAGSLRDDGPRRCALRRPARGTRARRARSGGTDRPHPVHRVRGPSHRPGAGTPMTPSPAPR